MELLIVFLMALSLHIVTDRGLTPMLPNRTDVVAIASQFASPQLFLDRWDTGEDLTGRDAFDDPYNFGWTIRRNRLDEKMHMIPIRPDFDECHFIPSGDFQAHRFQHLIHFRCKNHSSVFGWTYDMVDQDGSVMTFPNQLAHASVLIERTVPQQTRLTQQAAGN